MLKILSDVLSEQQQSVHVCMCLLHMVAHPHPSPLQTHPHPQILQFPGVLLKRRRDTTGFPDRLFYSYFWL